MTNKKKEKVVKKTPSAYDRFYPPVERPEMKKRSKKNDKEMITEGDKSADKKAGISTKEV